MAGLVALRKNRPQDDQKVQRLAQRGRRGIPVGRPPYLCKLMSMFLNMDRMIGKEFEAGLANLESAAVQRSGWSSTVAS